MMRNLRKKLDILCPSADFRCFSVFSSLRSCEFPSDLSLNNLLGCFVAEISGVVSSMESSESLSPVWLELGALDKLVLSARGLETVSGVQLAAFTVCKIDGDSDWSVLGAIWLSILISWTWFVLGLSCDCERQS